MNQQLGPLPVRGCVSALGIGLTALGGAAGIFYAVFKNTDGMLLAIAVLLIGIIALLAALVAWR